MQTTETDEGRKIVARATRKRGWDDDFPGWGDPNAADYLRPIPEGAKGTVTTVESHGNNPWTRYCVRFDNGIRAAGLVAGTDFNWA